MSKDYYDKDLLEQDIKNCLTNICEKDGNNYILHTDKLIYKGVKYFYTASREKELFSEANTFQYYGNLELAYAYAKRYSGGL